MKICFHISTMAFIAVLALPAAAMADTQAETAIELELELEQETGESTALKARQEMTAPGDSADADVAEPKEGTADEATTRETTTSKESAGAVARATFTTGIIAREPQDSIETLTNDTRMVYYFTEIAGLEGHTVTHRWERDGELMAEVPITIGGPRWRVYSTKNLEPGWTGQWKVSAIDDAGNVLETTVLMYTKVEPASDPIEEGSETDTPEA